MNGELGSVLLKAINLAVLVTNGSETLIALSRTLVKEHAALLKVWRAERERYTPAGTECQHSCRGDSGEICRYGRLSTQGRFLGVRL
jgi:hypothetical protein